jgi:phosphinothricin acetyltransferase
MGCKKKSELSRFTASQESRAVPLYGPQESRAVPLYGAELGGCVVGWAALSSFREAYTANGTLEDSVYVHLDFHRRGIGRRLLAELIGAARHSGLCSILANISADQTASIRLHEAMGFQKVAHLRRVGRKFDRWLDAVYLQLLLNSGDGAGG